MSAPGPQWPSEAPWAATHSTSPPRWRTRSTRCVTCSVTWPPEPAPRRPPGGRGHLVDPPGGEQAGRTAVEQCAGPLHGVEAAPVVAGGGDQPGRGDLGGDALGRRQVGGERLLDEQRQAVLDGDGLGLAVGERRHADVQRVGPHRPRERGGVGEGRGSASLRQRLGPDARRGPPTPTTATPGRPDRTRAWRSPTPPAPTSPTRTRSLATMPCAFPAGAAAIRRIGCGRRGRRRATRRGEQPAGGTAMQDDVAQWFAARTFHGWGWTATDLAAQRRGPDGRTGVTVVLPARNEQATVGAIVETLVRDLVHGTSACSTRSWSWTRARPTGPRPWRPPPALASCTSTASPPSWAPGAARATPCGSRCSPPRASCSCSSTPTSRTSPAATSSGCSARSCSTRRSRTSRRPTTDRWRPTPGVAPAGGGRVTELLARPLLNAWWPQLSGFVQPLSGEYAGRAPVLEQVPFVAGYGVEVGLLVDLLRLVGLDGLAQVDLERRVHRHQADQSLARMSGELLQALGAAPARRGSADARRARPVRPRPRRGLRGGALVAAQRRAPAGGGAAPGSGRRGAVPGPAGRPRGGRCRPPPRPAPRRVRRRSGRAGDPGAAGHGSLPHGPGQRRAVDRRAARRLRRHRERGRHPGRPRSARAGHRVILATVERQHRGGRRGVSRLRRGPASRASPARTATSWASPTPTCRPWSIACCATRRIDVVHDHLEVVGPAMLACAAAAARPPVLQTLHWDLAEAPGVLRLFDGRAGRGLRRGVRQPARRPRPANLRRQTLGVVPLAAPVDHRAARAGRRPPAHARAAHPVKGYDVAARALPARRPAAGPGRAARRVPADREALDAALADPGQPGPRLPRRRATSSPTSSRCSTATWSAGSGAVGGDAKDRAAAHRPGVCSARCGGTSREARPSSRPCWPACRSSASGAGCCRRWSTTA